MAKHRYWANIIFADKKSLPALIFQRMENFSSFISYGAVDRNATGTFLVHGDTLQLKSDKLAGKDFTIKNQSKQKSGYNIQFEDDNKYLIKDILCVFFVNGIQKELYSDSEGKVYADIPHCDRIYAQHPLFPDILTLVKDKNNDNNSFILTLNPSLAEVSFKGINFKIEDDKKLICLPNYFMDMEKIEFIK